MNATQTELAALAKLVSITPETHRHLYRRARPGEFVAADLLEGLYGPEHDTKPYTIVLPPLDTPAGDDVFLAPVMKWLRSEADIQMGTSPGFIHFRVRRKGCARWGKWKTGELGMTFPLLRACQSARVPEIVAIFGESPR